jgi:hypothetical protein
MGRNDGCDAYDAWTGYAALLTMISYRESNREKRHNASLTALDNLVTYLCVNKLGAMTHLMTDDALNVSRR